MTLQHVIEVSAEFEVDESAAVKQARALANEPNKSMAWYSLCSSYLKTLKTEEKSIKTNLDPLRAEAYRHYLNIRDLMTRLIKPRVDCHAIVSKPMCEWKNVEEARIRAEDQARLAADVKRADDEKMVAIETLIKQGNSILANAILESAGEANTPAPQEVKVDGIKHKKKWVARCVNKREFLHEVMAKPELTDSVEVNLKWLSQKATEQEGNMVVPGILFELEETISASGYKVP